MDLDSSAQIRDICVDSELDIYVRSEPTDWLGRPFYRRILRVRTADDVLTQHRWGGFFPKLVVRCGRSHRNLCRDCALRNDRVADERGATQPLSVVNGVGILGGSSRCCGHSTVSVVHSQKDINASATFPDSTAILEELLNLVMNVAGAISASDRVGEEGRGADRACELQLEFVSVAIRYVVADDRPHFGMIVFCFNAQVLDGLGSLGVACGVEVFLRKFDRTDGPVVTLPFLHLEIKLIIFAASHVEPVALVLSERIVNRGRLLILAPVIVVV